MNNLLLFLAVTFWSAYSGPYAPKSNEVIRSVDGGQSWQSISSGVPTDAQPLAFKAQDRTLYLATDQGFYQGTSTMSTQWQKVQLADPKVRDIFAGRKGTYYTGFYGGLFQQLAGTRLWIPLHQQLPDKIINDLLETSSDVLLLGCESGLYRSANHGATWQKVLTGTRVVSVVEAGTTLFAANEQGLWQSMDGGQNWSSAIPGKIRPFNLRKTATGLFCIAKGYQDRKGNILLFSPDNGKTWKTFANPADVALTDIYDFEQTESTFYACSKGGIFKSADQGKSWQQIISAPAQQGSYYNLVVDGSALYVMTLDGC